MNAIPSSAAALPPASQYVIPTQAMSRKNVACTYRPMPATVPSFQDHFISDPGASVVSGSAPYSLPLGDSRAPCESQAPRGESNRRSEERRGGKEDEDRGRWTGDAT